MSAWRLATHNEVSEIWQIRTRAILKGCASHYSPDLLVRWSGVEMPVHFSNVLLNNQAMVLVDDSDQLIGFGFIDRSSSSLEACFVDPCFIGEGHGKCLVRALEAQAIDAGLNALSLSASLNAVVFYQGLGYTLGNFSPWEHPAGFTIDAYAMYKSLV
ncbi:GNAT family N-acetyltransferase [Shewanella colwelliana]|uniref:GNAT family N-acetyltransferase n=1 Tax=Shewanella colwelliana TaxID=23 RepID=UPI0009DF5E16|nr:GNAT family N-acetyltransferase [Shewanella colwelliana]